MENVQYTLQAQVPNLKLSAISTCTIGGSWKSWLKLFASHSKFCLKMCYSQFYRWIPYPHHMTLLPDAMESVHTFAVFPLNCSRDINLIDSPIPKKTKPHAPSTMYQFLFTAGCWNHLQCSNEHACIHYVENQCFCSCKDSRNFVLVLACTNLPLYTSLTLN